MTSLKDAQNIYGYTGKRSENYNFLTIRRSHCSVSSSPKPCGDSHVASSSKQDVVLKSKWTNPIQFVSFSFPEEEWEFYVQEKEDSNKKSLENEEWFCHVSLPSLTFSLGNKEITIATFRLESHEKGYSVKMDVYGLFATIQTDGDRQTICFSRTKPPKMTLTNSKISFLQREYPFSFQFEENKECDGIFNDFISSHLPKINPPESYVVPVKQTPHRISYRQYIGGYMKTKTLFQFTIRESGWTFENRVDEESTSLVKGVDIQLKHEWTYFPWGSRIEHSLYFI